MTAQGNALGFSRNSTTPKSALAFRAQPANFPRSMPVPDSPAPALSKMQIFLRRLASTVMLWTAILAAMFSGQPLIADGVFVLLIALLALAGLMEFYGLAQKRGLACFKVSGVIGGVLLMCGTFAHLHGWLGIYDSPARVNDFETDFLILFVLGLGVRQLLRRTESGRPERHRRDVVRPDVRAVAAEFHPENQLFPGRGRQVFPALFHSADQIQRHGRVCRRLAHWPAQDDSAHQPRQDVGGFGGRDCGLDRRERGVRAFSGPPHGRHEPRSTPSCWASS